MACDGDLLLVVRGSSAEMSDVSRDERYFNPRATPRLVAPATEGSTYSCYTIPAQWCDVIHYLDPCSIGHRIDLNNGALLYRRHHARVNQTNRPTKS